MYLIQIQKAKFPKTGELKFSSWITTPATPVEDRLPPELAQCGDMITCRAQSSGSIQGWTHRDFPAHHELCWSPELHEPCPPDCVRYISSVAWATSSHGRSMLACPSLSLPHIVEIGLLWQRVVKLHTNIYRIHGPLPAALKESTSAFVALMSPAWYCREKIRTGAHQSWKPWTTIHPITWDCTVNGPFPTSFLLWLPAVIELSLVWVVGLSGEEVWIWLPLRCRLWGVFIHWGCKAASGMGRKVIQGKKLGCN